MANTTTTQYMVLVLPIPEVEIGPDWAQELIAAFNRIDIHDHTSDLGVPITPAALDINDDIDMDGNSLIGTESVVLNNLSSLSTPCAVYRIGNNLYYNNAAGTPVQITTGNVVNAPGSGVIVAAAPPSYPYNVLSTDAQTVQLIDTNAARTINLPAATTTMFFMIKDQDGLAQTNNISIVPNGTDVIDGVNSPYVIDWNYGSIGLVSDGISAWYVV